jgi:hypothetical protein
MKKITFLSLLTSILIAFAGCSNGLLSHQSSPLSLVDINSGPSVLSINPTDGEDHVSTSSPVTAIFSRDIDPATVSLSSFVLADNLYNTIDGTFSFPDPRTVVFTPALPLDFIAEYNVLLTPDIKDTGGARLASEKIWYFTTKSSGTVPDPTFDPAPGSYEGPRTITISCLELDATIMYTTDGTDPGPLNGAVYSGPFTVADNTASSIRAIAFEAGSVDSSIVQADYTIQAIMPQIDPSPGIYSGSLLITLSTPTPGGTIQYAMDGGTYSAYTVPFMIPSSSTVTAVASHPDMADSPFLTAAFIINTGQVAPPVFTPAPGTYTSALQVAISSPTPGAIIRYTTDGSDPVTGGITGTLVTISDSTILAGYAYDPTATLADSSISSGNYIIAPTILSIEPDKGPNYAPVEVTIQGTHFKTGVIVQLNRNNLTPIYGTSVTLVNSTTITCTLDITGRAKGKWSLVVTNPDSGSALKNEFRIY